ncbi:putative reverse transcriptase domain-containing protein [Tanacetum coccineum]
MADHSQKWHDGSSSRNIDSSSNSEGITAIVNKLDSLGHDMKKIKENMHAIQIGCQTYRGSHLDKECPINEDVKCMEEVKYGEFSRPFPNNSINDGRFNRGASGYDQPSSGEGIPSLTEIINKYIEEEAKRRARQDKWLNFNNDLANLGASISIMPLSMYKCLGIGKLKPINMVIEMADNTKCTPKGLVENLLVKIDKLIFQDDFVILDIVEDIRMPVILGRPLLATDHSKFNYLLAIDPNIFTYEIEVQESYEEVVYRMTKQEDPWKIEKMDEANLERHQDLTPMEKPKIHWCKAIPQEKEYECEYWASCNPYRLSLNDWMKIRYGKVCKMTRERILKDHWRKRFGEEENDIEENSEDSEEYGEDKANTVTRYTIGPEEIYTKVKVLRIDEMARTRDNVASIRARLMEKIAKEGNGHART